MCVSHAARAMSRQRGWAQGGGGSSVKRTQLCGWFPHCCEVQVRVNGVQWGYTFTYTGPCCTPLSQVVQDVLCDQIGVSHI
jgi:hypothetical protein